jgi:hypothetical protein
MPTTAQLDETLTCVLDATGQGTVTFQPSSSRTVWSPTSCAVTVDPNVLEPVCNVYLGSVTGTNLGGTFAGSNDTCTFPGGMTVYPGQQITVQWTGGDVGAVARADLYGSLVNGGTAQ